MKNNKGFSLVELIVVIAIMAILAAVAIPTFATFITKANEASDISFMNDLEYAIELAYTTEGKDVDTIKVTLNDDKTVNKVEVKFVGDADNVAATVITKGATAQYITDVAQSIDWNYKFKADPAQVVNNQNWAADDWSFAN